MDVPPARAALLACILGSTPALGQVYHAVELPMLPGGTAASARAINESGVVVGESNTSLAGYPEAVVWLEDGPLHIAGSGTSGSISTDISESGLVVGFTDEVPGGFMFDGTAYVPIAPILLFSGAMAVTDGHVIVGVAMHRATVWRNGRATQLPSFQECCSMAHDVNNTGVVVGEATAADGRSVAVRWVDDEIQVVADFGGIAALAHGISEAGQIVGEAWLPPEPGGPFETRAFSWSGGRATELPSLDGIDTRAFAINNHGVIVGTSTVVFLTPRAVVWRQGEIHDLNDLVVSGDRRLVLVHAYGINDAGQIVGMTEDMRAFRLDPIAAVAGDLDDDGSVGVGDLLILLAAWGTCPDGDGCPADLDGSGDIGVGDLLMLLASWS